MNNRGSESKSKFFIAVFAVFAIALVIFYFTVINMEDDSGDKRGPVAEEYEITGTLTAAETEPVYETEDNDAEAESAVTAVTEKGADKTAGKVTVAGKTTVVSAVTDVSGTAAVSGAAEAAKQNEQKSPAGEKKEEQKAPEASRAPEAPKDEAPKPEAPKAEASKAPEPPKAPEKEPEKPSPAPPKERKEKMIEIDINRDMKYSGNDDEKTYHVKYRDFIAEDDIIDSVTFFLKTSDGSELNNVNGGFGITVKNSCKAKTSDKWFNPGDFSREYPFDSYPISWEIPDDVKNELLMDDEANLMLGYYWGSKEKIVLEKVQLHIRTVHY